MRQKERKDAVLNRLTFPITIKLILLSHFPAHAKATVQMDISFMLLSSSHQMSVLRRIVFNLDIWLITVASSYNASHSQILTEYRSQFSLHNSINVLWFTPCSYSGLLVLSSVKRTSDPSRRIAWTVDKRWLHAPAFKEWRQTILISNLHTWLSISPNLGDQSGGHPALARVTGSYALFVFRLFPEYLSFSWHSDFLFYNN